MSQRILLSITSASLLLAATGCKKDESEPVAPSTGKKTLPTPNDDDDLKAASEFMNKGSTAGTNEANGGTMPPNHPPMSPAKGQPASPGTEAITYSAPADWKPQPVTSQMRKAQFLIPHAATDKEDGQMIVFYFGQGQGGAVESNIARWKGMFSTADGKPVPDSATKRESHEVNGMKVTTLDISGRFVDAMGGRATSGPEDWRMLSAIVETPAGPYFFKGVGPLATMKAQEQNFKRFVESVKRRS